GGLPAGARDPRPPARDRGRRGVRDGGAGARGGARPRARAPAVREAARRVPAHPGEAGAHGDRARRSPTAGVSRGLGGGPGRERRGRRGCKGGGGRGGREQSVRIVCVGGGPAGLYFAILMKNADPSHEIRVLERNPLDATFGFGVVFSDAAQMNLAEADRRTYEEMTRAF